MEQQPIPISQVQGCLTTTSPTSDDRQRQIDSLLQALAETRPYNLRQNQLDDPTIYNLHAKLLVACANSILSRHGKSFVIDDDNKAILRFLLYYFNGSTLALDMFPDADYRLDKNIMLVGSVGAGKTLLMDAFALYLQKTNNQRKFTAISQTQLLNHYKQRNNIDYYTFNTADSRSFEGRPFSLCLNDMGLRTQRFYGTDTEIVIEEFLYARYEIWEQFGKWTHITTNLDKQEISSLFQDAHNRLADRFKMFNVIHLKGNSRR